ncbi:MAG: molybdopterin-guanine dinucleotide biosynthesis protein B [Thalassovita sp.]|nr:molybdopterin-guanine dinucleotide biosynthesis protein B [Thalassovita sp.]
MKLYGVTGWKNGGKTGLMERLVAEFCTRGLRVSTIKHAHHSTDVDQPGRDSFRHREAGAAEVMLASPNRWALMHELRGDAEPSLADLLAKMTPADLILIEGYKREAHTKIEAFRHENGKPPLAERNDTIRAVASNTALTDLDLPVIDLDDTAAIADFIQKDLNL